MDYPLLEIQHTILYPIFQEPEKFCAFVFAYDTFDMIFMMDAISL